MRDREWRRYQRDRKITKVRNWIRAHYYWSDSEKTQEEKDSEAHESALKRHSAPHSCSRYCCGNPRVHFGTQPLDEFKWQVSCIEEFDELGVRHNLRLNNRRW